jgi:ATP-binding cassette, subfamily B, bacterial HlyB/CyaB
VEAAQKASGLQCLMLLLRFHQIPVEAGRISHQFAGAEVGVSEISRCAKNLHLKAKVVAASWKSLAGLPQPGIAQLKDRTFILVGRVTEDSALIQNPWSAGHKFFAAKNSRKTGRARSF